MWGISVLLAGRRKANKDNVIVIASASLSGQLLANYRLRWEIETLFGCLKTRGFRLEDTHLTKQERVSRLLGWLATLVLLGGSIRRVGDEKETAQTQKTWQTGKVSLSRRLGLFTAAFMSSDRERTKARKQKAYLTFVLYLVVSNISNRKGIHSA